MAITKVTRTLLSTGIDDQSNATAITIDSSENVGIGTSSPARKVQIQDTSSTVYLSLVGPTNAGAGIMFGDSDDETVGRITYDNSNNGMQVWTNDSEKIRIDSSGNVGIGTSSPATELHVKASSGDCELRLEAVSGSEARLRFGDATDNDAGYIGYSRSSGYINFSALNTAGEHMRIDSSGNLFVGTTDRGNASTLSKVVNDSSFLSRGSLAGYFWENRSGMTIASQSGWGGWYSTSTASHFLYSDGANRASIGRTSGTYTALSDVNKKKDFEDSTVGLAEVMQLKPKKFRMLEDADDAPKKLGFIAQDVENVIPEAYVEDTNEDASGVENTFIGLTDRPIIAALTKAIQEQQTIIDNLKTRIETLESA